MFAGSKPFSSSTCRDVRRLKEVLWLSESVSKALK